MSFIKDIRDIVGDNGHPVRIEVWEDNCVTISIWESEVTIAVDFKKKEIRLEPDTQNTGFSPEEVEELGRVMKYIQSHLDDLNTLVNGV